MLVSCGVYPLTQVWSVAKPPVREMKGVGGPLLCIGDLISDLEDNPTLTPHDAVSGSEKGGASSLPSSSSAFHASNFTIQSSDLTKLFQEHYDCLSEALAGTDHSWTALTMKLCEALETANKLVWTTNSNARLLLEKVAELEKIVKRGDSAVAAAKSIHASLQIQSGQSSGSLNNQ